jgi:predicted aspartyl protease
MQRALAFLWCGSLVAGDIGQLQQLADKNRFFELRRDLQQPGWAAAETLFYRALITSRFGHETEGIELLQKVLETNPNPAVARKTREEIASAFARLGRYKDAAHAWGEALLLTPGNDPERQGNENTRALMAALSDVAPETAELGADVPIKATRNRLGSWDAPVQVNDVNGQWIFDTGANISTLAATEAKRMGLSVRETTAYVNGSTERRNALQLAVASDLRLGTAHVHNVVFLVLADQALNIGPLRYQITGILGIPVLRALSRLEISSTGLIRVYPHETLPQRTSNLFFDEASLIVEVGHDQHNLQMFLDTGANATVCYPSFREALGRQEKMRLRTKREKVAGAGGTIQRKTEVVPAVRIEILGKAIDLRKLSLLSAAPIGIGRYRDGVIGMDALLSGFKLDFDAMRLEIE